MKLKMMADDVDKQSWLVDQKTMTSSGNVYRRVLDFNFITGGKVDSVLINQLETEFHAEFLSQEYSLVDDADIAKSTDAQFVIIKLPKAVNIKRIFVQLGKINKIYLMGESIKEKEFNKSAWKVSSSFSDSETSLEGESTGGIKEIAIKENEKLGILDAGVLETIEINPIRIELFRVDGDAISTEPTMRVINNADINEFISASFAIRVINSSGSIVENLKTTQLKALFASGQPLNPRLGISLSSNFQTNEGEAVDFFWNGAERLSADFADDSEALDARPNSFVSSLQRVLDNYFLEIDNELLLGNINLYLIIESDGPCQFELSQFVVDYRLIKKQSVLLDEQKKMTQKMSLRYQGDQYETQSVLLSLPSNAKIIKADMNVNLSLTGGESFLGEDGLKKLNSMNGFGVQVAQQSWVAQAIVLDKSININAIAIAVMGLENESELIVQLQSDWNDVPSGEVLAQGLVKLKQAGERVWGKITLGSSQLLSTQTYWLLLKSAKGASVWFTYNDVEGSGEIGRQSYPVIDSRLSPQAVTLIKSQTAYYELLSTRPQNKALQIPFSVSINEEDIGFTVSSDTTVNFNIKNNLTTVMKKNTTAGTFEVKLCFNSIMPVFLNVYAPQIEYDLQ